MYLKAIFLVCLDNTSGSDWCLIMIMITLKVISKMVLDSLPVELCAIATFSNTKRHIFTLFSDDTKENSKYSIDVPTNYNSGFDLFQESKE